MQIHANGIQAVDCDEVFLGEDLPDLFVKYPLLLKK